MRLLGRSVIVALAITAGACASHQTTGVATIPRPRPFPGAPLPPVEAEPPAPAPAAPPEMASAPLLPSLPGGVVAVALGYRGVPYRFGGSDPAGFDCSGFIQYVFKQIGSILPREVKDQVRIGREIDLEDVKAGDLVFFNTEQHGASHVGLAIGDGQFVHAPSTNGVVRVERLTSSYWAPRFVVAKRIS